MRKFTRILPRTALTQAHPAAGHDGLMTLRRTTQSHALPDIVEALNVPLVAVVHGDAPVRRGWRNRVLQVVCVLAAWVALLALLVE